MNNKRFYISWGISGHRGKKGEREIVGRFSKKGNLVDEGKNEEKIEIYITHFEIL